MFKPMATSFVLDVPLFDLAMAARFARVKTTANTIVILFFIGRLYKIKTIFFYNKNNNSAARIVVWTIYYECSTSFVPKLRTHTEKSNSATKAQKLKDSQSV